MHYSIIISVLTVLVTVSVEVFAGGEVIILSKPSNVEFNGHDECDIGILSDICSTSLGFTTYQTKKWSGMYVTNPFEFAEALVLVAIEGVRSIGLNEGHTFPLNTSESVEEVWNSLESEIYDRYSDSGDNVVKINLDEGVTKVEYNLNKGALNLRGDTVPYLNNDEEYDAKLNHQLSLMDAISNKILERGVTMDGLPDLYWINLNGLHAIIDFYGESSTTAAEAKDLVKSSLQHLKKMFDSAYHNKTMIVVVQSDSAHTRRYRRAINNEVIGDLNIAATYDENYPVFFNIFFWFTIAFIMAIIATSMATAGMDPGRDSIIYRMTSTRMKKDN